MSEPQKVTADDALGTALGLRPYRLTFGTRYRHEAHPSGAKWITPEGWVEIRAEDGGKARGLAFELFGPAWAFLYDELRTLEPRHYPLGRLAIVHQKMTGRCVHCHTTVIFSPSWQLAHFDTLIRECSLDPECATVAELEGGAR